MLTFALIFTIFPMIVGIMFFWVLIAFFVFLVKFFGANKTQDVAQRKIQKGKAWKIFLIPLVIFIVLTILYSFVLMFFAAHNLPPQQ
jgi:heme/copper-type cytochrome/quinol oxidase subunit 2